MINIIKDKIKEIETQNNVKILHCVESGSRAWGFASPDSDFDVRFIYVRPMEDYLRLEKTRDVIEWQLDDTLDINGWDLQKALRLLHNSNPTLFEWNSSPIVYQTTKEWEKVSEIIDEYFIQRSGIYHYLSTAKTNYREYLKAENVKLKKYFYVLRPILACKWIIDKGTPPPMLFNILADTYLDESIKAEVDKLVEIKINSPEIQTARRIDKLNEYIENNIAQLDSIVASTPDDGKRDWTKLNEMFLSIIKSSF